MRCLSLYQPWAALMEIEAKRNETRSWGTKYRGPVAIHAGKRWTGVEQELAWQEPFRETLSGHRVVRGAILCVVDLFDCVQITHEYASTIQHPEFAFGNYAPGRWAWRTRMLYRLSTPVIMRGFHGLFELPDDIISRVEARKQVCRCGAPSSINTVGDSRCSACYGNDCYEADVAEGEY